MNGIRVGLRIDADTFRGTRDGIPTLVDLLAKYDIKATFFMSVGPDNMGRHFWRLLKPRFLQKMLRSNAISLYGYHTLLCGTAWSGPVIGDRLADIIRLPDKAGHEVGLHAWDHYRWQAHIDRLAPQQMEEQIRLGFNKLADILGRPPACSAAAGWRCNEQALALKEKFNFSYNSDCRGISIFRPVIDGRKLTPQIPVTLPTYDEAIGQNGITDDNYNDFVLSKCKPGQLNVYTIHAEVEGVSRVKLFEQMLVNAKQRGIQFVPLKELVAGQTNIPSGLMVKKEWPGREGWLAAQG